MAITFQKSGMDDLVIERGRLLPKDDKLRLNQERHLTESNNPKVIVYGDALELLELNFKNLTKENYDGATHGIKTWFQNSNINWSENNFTLIDENGLSYTVRYWSDTFSMPLIFNGRYSTSLVLLKES